MTQSAHKILDKALNMLEAGHQVTAAENKTAIATLTKVLTGISAMETMLAKSDEIIEAQTAARKGFETACDASNHHIQTLEELNYHLKTENARLTQELDRLTQELAKLQGKDTCAAAPQDTRAAAPQSTKQPPTHHHPEDVPLGWYWFHPAQKWVPCNGCKDKGVKPAPKPIDPPKCRFGDGCARRPGCGYAHPTPQRDGSKA
jgi:TolA-binding protein